MEQVVLKDGWLQLQDAAHNAVVQVIAQIAKFNWLEPYRVQEQGENRGTGFFIDAQGHLITNAHVVNEAIKIWIHVPSMGRKNIFADIVSICPERDLALLRVQPEDWEFLQKTVGAITPLTLGDSDLVQRTQRVLVLGYPLGQYRMKSSTGVISGRESINGRSLIQITAPVNPGNSGGPLLNAQGEVIGIAISMIFLAQNVGYAIPINELKIILDDLYKRRFVRVQTLGFSYNYSDDALARYLGNPLPGGLYINKVYPQSLMEKAQLQAGDMLYEFNHFRLDGFGDATAPWSYDKIGIMDLVGRLKVDDTVVLMVYRNGERIEKKIIFKDTPPYPVRARYPTFEHIDYEVIGGMVIMELADNHIPLLMYSMPFIIQYARIECKLKPLLVITHIMPGSLAQQIRALIPGFTIKEINGNPVATLQELRDTLKQTRDKYVTVKTHEDAFVVFPWDQLVEDNKQLSQTFSFPLSKIFN